MTVFAHAAVSIFLGARKKSFSDILFFGFAGMLPDLPLGLIALTGSFTSDTHHHEWITHTPLFWAIISVLVFFVNRRAALILLIGTWSHLAFDWFGGGDGIMFLWPWSKEQFGVALSGVHGRPAFEKYFSNPLFLGMEIICGFYLIWKVLGIFLPRACNKIRSNE